MVLKGYFISFSAERKEFICYIRLYWMYVTGNVDYILKHNNEIIPDKVEVCPNCIDVIDTSVNSETRIKIRKQYNIPINKIVFVYGGNLGKPQGIPF